jgi:hypothetical protein
VSFIVTVRGKQSRDGGKQRWDILKRVEAETSREAVEKAFETLNASDGWAVTIMRKHSPSPMVVGCVVVEDRYGDRHAFRYEDKSVTVSWLGLCKVTQEWAKTSPCDAGEALHVYTSYHTDPGFARLDRHLLKWGELTVEK